MSASVLECKKPEIENKKTECAGITRWLKSAMLWTVAFIAIGILVAVFLPSRCLSAADGVTGTFRVLVTKLAAFLPSQENPDVVFMGSSLVLTPAVRCDDKLEGKAACYDRWYYDRYIPEYTKSTYFEKQVKDKLGLNLSVKNLGVASSIMSDQSGIFKLMIEEKKHPKLLILGLAPRDFLDNTQQKHLETPTRQFIREYEQNSLLPTRWSAAQIRETGVKIQHRLEKVIAKIRSTAVDLACSVSGHKARAEYSVSTYVGDRPNKLKDLETYKKLYNPPNFSMLEQQSNYLRKLLVAASNNNVNVLVVNMPLTKENIATLDSKAYKAYVDSMRQLSKQNNAKFVDIGTECKGYTLKDFEDCCHLNSSGGEKFYATLVSEMSSDTKLLGALSSNTQAIASTKTQTR